MGSLKKSYPMLRFEFIRYINKASVRTFNKKIYDVKTGLIFKNVESSELRGINEIYYDIRTVRDKTGNIIAKRKNKNSELYLVKKNN